MYVFQQDGVQLQLTVSASRGWFTTVVHTQQLCTPTCMANHAIYVDSPCTPHTTHPAHLPPLTCTPHTTHPAHLTPLTLHISHHSPCTPHTTHPAHLPPLTLHTSHHSPFTPHTTHPSHLTPLPNHTNLIPRPSTPDGLQYTASHQNWRCRRPGNKAMVNDTACRGKSKN